MNKKLGKKNAYFLWVGKEASRKKERRGGESLAETGEEALQRVSTARKGEDRSRQGEDRNLKEKLVSKARLKTEADASGVERNSVRS